MSGHDIVEQDHRIDTLDFFLRNPSVAAAERFTSFMTLLRRRNWTLGPPELVDEHEADSACRNLGGVVSLYCAHPPWGEKLPYDLDAAQFRETSQLLRDLCVLSLETGPIAIWFDGEEIGEVANGRMDVALQQGLLTEWERGLRMKARRGGRTRG